MATIIAENDGKELFPMRYIADLFKNQTLQQLRINMMTQRIWPFGPTASKKKPSTPGVCPGTI